MAAKLQPTLFPLKQARWNHTPEDDLLWEYSTCCVDADAALAEYERIDTLWLDDEATDVERDAAWRRYDNALRSALLACDKVRPYVKDWWTGPREDRDERYRHTGRPDCQCAECVREAM